jgi:hypothetical protein
MVDMTERPFFVVGSPRSGTTLLRFILSSHPRIYIPAETGFIPFLPHKARGLLTFAQVTALLARIGRLNREWDGLVQDLPSFYQALPGPTLEHVLDALYQRKIRGHGATRWGDKTPSYVLHISTLNEIFPTAQFIHVIRDGRDATLSAQKKWGAQSWYMDNYYLLRNWVRAVERGCAAGRELGAGRYHEVRYEALVQRPGPTIESLCTFLGEEFHPGMLEHTRLARTQIGPGGHIEVREPISSASVGRWKDQMSAFDRKMADRVAGTTLSALGYESAGETALSVGEGIRLRCLSSKYLLVDLLRKALTVLGLLTLNRSKRKRR